MKKHTFMFLFLSVWTRADTNSASQSFLKHVDDEFYQTEAMKFSVVNFPPRCTTCSRCLFLCFSLRKDKYLPSCEKKVTFLSKSFASQPLEVRALKSDFKERFQVKEKPLFSWNYFHSILRVKLCSFKQKVFFFYWGRGTYTHVLLESLDDSDVWSRLA